MSTSFERPTIEGEFLRSETYTCATENGTEYGWCFKRPEDAEDCITGELVVGLCAHNDPRTEEACNEGWERTAWMAEAIVKAATKDVV